MTTTKKGCRYLLMMSSVLLAGMCGTSEAESPSSQPLLHASDLVYIGAFRVPSGNYGGTGGTFSYGGTAPAYNNAANSLLLVGHAQYNLTAEIGIPTPGNSSSLTALPVAPVIQPFGDVTGGLINIYGTSMVIGGQLVYQGKLIATEYIYYDASNSQTAAHFMRPTTSLTSGQVSGLYPVWDPNKTGYVSGFLATIPPEWQSLLGGTVIAGNCCIPIISRTSLGPSAFAFDPSTYSTSLTPAIPLLYYPSDHPTLGTWAATGKANPVYNMTTSIMGLVFPGGTRTLLYFGSTGLGIPCYGQGTNDRSLDRTPVPGTDGQVIYCYDPANTTKGNHAYPYAYFAWAYDANDLLAVRNGSRQPWEIVPYATWSMDFPVADKLETNRIGGAAYDPANGTIYLSQLNGEIDGYARLPVVHVLKIQVSAGDVAVPTALPAPTSLSVK